MCRPFAAIIKIHDASHGGGGGGGVDTPGYNIQVLAMEWCTYGIPAEGVASRLVLKLAFRGGPGTAAPTVSALREFTIKRPIQDYPGGQEAIICGRGNYASHCSELKPRASLVSLLRWRVKVSPPKAAAVAGNAVQNRMATRETKTQGNKKSGRNSLEPK